MTDDEINRRVAGIEGWVRIEPDAIGLLSPGAWQHHELCQDTSGYYCVPGTSIVSELPPPYATDWAWCGPLIEKYRVDFQENINPHYPDPNEPWRALCMIGPMTDEYADCAEGFALTPQRAICLAVIAAKQS